MGADEFTSAHSPGDCQTLYPQAVVASGSGPTRIRLTCRTNRDTLRPLFEFRKVHFASGGRLADLLKYSLSSFPIIPLRRTLYTGHSHSGKPARVRFSGRQSANRECPRWSASPERARALFRTDRRQLAMSFDYTLPRIDTALVTLPDAPATLAVEPQRWWTLTQIVLAGLLGAYLVGMVQDFQRVRDLRAEPSPLSKIIITKNEAWQRIYPRSVRSGVVQIGARAGTAASPQP